MWNQQQSHNNQHNLWLKLKDSTLLDLTPRTFLMGIINVTPDSFFDGGKYFDRDIATELGLRFVEEGADFLDVGGESTRPGAEPVTAEEEIRRVVPVIRDLALRVKVPISVDSYKAQVARAAIDAGASMVNDISGLGFDPDMPRLIAETHSPVVIMHIKGRPKDMQLNPSYTDLIGEIMEYLKKAMDKAISSGIDKERIIIDPGIGFGKTVRDNLKIIKKLWRFKALGKPIMVGTSHKSFIGKVLNASVNDREEGTLATNAVAILKGANILRVHDVKKMKRAALMVDAIRKC